MALYIFNATDGKILFPAHYTRVYMVFSNGKCLTTIQTMVTMLHEVKLFK